MGNTYVYVPQFNCGTAKIKCWRFSPIKFTFFTSLWALSWNKDIMKDEVLESCHRSVGKDFSFQKFLCRSQTPLQKKRLFAWNYVHSFYKELENYFSKETYIRISRHNKSFFIAALVIACLSSTPLITSVADLLFLSWAKKRW